MKGNCGKRCCAFRGCKVRVRRAYKNRLRSGGDARGFLDCEPLADRADGTGGNDGTGPASALGRAGVRKLRCRAQIEPA